LRYVCYHIFWRRKIDRAQNQTMRCKFHLLFADSFCYRYGYTASHLFHLGASPDTKTSSGTTGSSGRRYLGRWLRLVQVWWTGVAVISEFVPRCREAGRWRRVRAPPSSLGFPKRRGPTRRRIRCRAAGRSGARRCVCVWCQMGVELRWQGVRVWWWWWWWRREGGWRLGYCCFFASTSISSA